eukprot:1048729-Pyramimonas_sp.AAC.1
MDNTLRPARLLRQLNRVQPHGERDTKVKGGCVFPVCRGLRLRLRMECDGVGSPGLSWRSSWSAPGASWNPLRPFEPPRELSESIRERVGSDSEAVFSCRRPPGGAQRLRMWRCGIPRKNVRHGPKDSRFPEETAH